jgi:hypothetical protein
MPAGIVPSRRGRNDAKRLRQLNGDLSPDDFGCGLIVDLSSELEVDKWRDPLGTERINHDKSSS